MLALGTASAAPGNGNGHATGQSVRTNVVVGGPNGAIGPDNSPAAMPGHAATAESTNWSGYADMGHTYTSVTSSWVQPAANCHRTRNGYAAFWVGLDGANSQTVEQTGTDADCSHGRPVYYAWYEFFNNADPAGTPSYDYTDTVRPGDHFTATSTYNGGNSYTESITDETQGWQEVTNGTDAGTQSSAEVIAEAPSSISGTTLTRLPLADYGNIVFDNMTSNGGNFGAVGNATGIDMYNTSRTTEDAGVSNLAGGNAFNDVWFNAN